MDGISQNGALAGSGNSAGVERQSETRKDASLSDAKNFALMFCALLQQKAASQLSSSMFGGNLGESSALAGLDTSGKSLVSVVSAMESGTQNRGDLALLLLSSMLGSSLNTEGSSFSYIPSLSALSAPTDCGPLMIGSASAIAAVLPESSWMAASPSVTGDESCRSATLLNAVIGQFQVETSERYRPYKNGNDTYCNIYVWDVTGALGAEIPHYVDPETGAPRTYPDVAGAKELSANGICDWLDRYAGRYGWTETDAETAQEYADRGCPAITAWKNESGASGHVQVVCPSQNGGYDPARGVTVSQAGRNNYSRVFISSTFSAQRLSQVKYFVHA